MILRCLNWRRILGSLFLRSCVIAIPCGVVAYLCHHHLHKHFEDWSTADAGLSIYSGFSFSLGFLMVFRMNQAYSRWWEAGTLLQQARAQWFNAYSSLIALSSPVADKAGQVLRFHHMLARLMSLLYGVSILQVSTMQSPSVQTVHIEGLDEAHVKFLEDCHDKVEVVLQWIQKAVVAADSDGSIEAAAPIVSRVYSQLGNGMVNVTSARKMIEFPTPVPILQMIPFMLCVQWLATVTLCTMLVGSSSWAAVLSFMTTFCFWSINYLARELEMPFGDDPDDLPVQYLQADMNASLAGLLHPLALRTPSFELPLSAEGNVNLHTGIMELQPDGTMDFRPSRKLICTAIATSDGLNETAGPSKSSALPDDSFHVQRPVKGKKGTFKRGPTPQASARRVQATRAHTPESHAVATAVYAESQSRPYVSNLGGTSAQRLIKTVPEATRQSDPGSSPSSGDDESQDRRIKCGISPAELPVQSLQLCESSI